MKTIRRRIHSPLTEQQRSRHRVIREEVASELPALKQIGRAVIAKRDRLHQTLGDLKAERQRLGLSLTDVSERSGIDKAALSRLENAGNGNPTWETLMRYAQAIGVDLRIQIVRP